MFGDGSDQCTVFEALYGKCQHGCQVQLESPSCVYVPHLYDNENNFVLKLAVVIYIQ